MEYQHLSIQKLYELYEKYKDEIGGGLGMMAMMWRAISPQIPDILEGLDNNEEMLGKLKNFLIDITAAMEADTKQAEDIAGELEDKAKGKENDGGS